MSATCDMGIPYYINTLQFENAEELVKILTDKWEFIVQKVEESKLLFYAYHCYLLYWIIGDEDNKLKWYNIALNYSRAKNGKGLFFLTMLLNLTSEYSKGYLLYFDKKIITLHKTIDNNDHLSPFEKIILKYFKKLYNVGTNNKSVNLTYAQKESQEMATFSEFKDQLNALKNTSDKFIQPTGYEEIILWIESNLQQKSIREVFHNFVSSQNEKNSLPHTEVSCQNQNQNSIY